MPRGPEEWRSSASAPLRVLSIPLQKHTRTSCPQVAFLNSALASAQEEQAQLRGQLKEQKLRCRRLAQVVAPSQRELEEAPGPSTGGESVPVETHQTLQVAMDKLQVRKISPSNGRAGRGAVGGASAPEPACWLQSRFTELMQEKVDLKERVEELEHRCIQLSGETDTIGEWDSQGRGIVRWIGSLTAEPCPPGRPPAGEYIALYQSQRAVLKQRHREKEEYISRLVQDKEEMKVEALTISAGGGRWGRSRGVGC